MYRRAKDTGTPVGEWFSELVREDAWFKDLMPNVRSLTNPFLATLNNEVSTFIRL